jgi:hypothetical protein
MDYKANCITQTLQAQKLFNRLLQSYQKYSYTKKKKKLHSFSPLANYTDRAIAASQRS